MKKDIKNLLKNLKINYSNEDIDKLFLYYCELVKWGKCFSLIGSFEKKFFIYQLKDVISGFSVFEKYMFPNCKIADVGSGNGLLSIFMSVIFKEHCITAIEKKQKKVSFLNSIKNLLDLENFKIIGEKVQNVKESFDIITMKAFLPINKTNINLLNGLFSENKSIILAYVSKAPEKLKNYKLNSLNGNRHILEINSLKNI